MKSDQEAPEAVGSLLPSGERASPCNLLQRGLCPDFRYQRPSNAGDLVLTNRVNALDSHLVCYYEMEPFDRLITEKGTKQPTPL